MNGQTGASGDPAHYQDDLRVQFAITPLYGERGFPSVCGERVARPRPRPAERSPKPACATVAAVVAAAAAAAAAADGGGGGGGETADPLRRALESARVEHDPDADPGRRRG